MCIRDRSYMGVVCWHAPYRLEEVRVGSAVAGSGVGWSVDEGFPAEVVDAVITECGRTEKRRRSLPARSMAYFAMGMALHSEGSYEDVLAMISDGLAWAHRDERSGKLANKAAFSDVV